MPTDAESNWANQLTMGIIKIQYKIEDAKGKVDTKKESKNMYCNYLYLKYTKIFYHPKAFADFAAASSNACVGSFIP